MTLVLAILAGFLRWAPVVLTALMWLLALVARGPFSDQALILSLVLMIALQVLVIFERRRYRMRMRGMAHDLGEAIGNSGAYRMPEAGRTRLTDGSVVDRDSYSRGAKAMGEWWQTAIKGITEPHFIDDLATVIWNATEDRKLFVAQFRALPRDQQQPTHERARAAASFIRARMLSPERADQPDAVVLDPRLAS